MPIKKSYENKQVKKYVKSLSEKEKIISGNRVTRKLAFIFHKLSKFLEEGEYSGTDRNIGNL